MTKQKILEFLKKRPEVKAYDDSYEDFYIEIDGEIIYDVLPKPHESTDVLIKRLESALTVIKALKPIYEELTFVAFFDVADGKYQVSLEIKSDGRLSIDMTAKARISTIKKTHKDVTITYGACDGDQDDYVTITYRLSKTLDTFNRLKDDFADYIAQLEEAQRRF